MLPFTHDGVIAPLRPKRMSGNPLKWCKEFGYTHSVVTLSDHSEVMLDCRRGPQSVDVSQGANPEFNCRPPIKTAAWLSVDGSMENCHPK